MPSNMLPCWKQDDLDEGGWIVSGPNGSISGGDHPEVGRNEGDDQVVAETLM